MSRVAKADDALAIATVQVAAWRTAYRGLMSDTLLQDLDVKAKAERWRHTIASPELRVIVVERSGCVVGFALASGARDPDVAAPDVGEICAMYVSPQHWRQGCGRELLQGTLAYFASTRRTRQILWVLEANTSARRFYEAQGFAPDGATKTHPASGLIEMRYFSGAAMSGV